MICEISFADVRQYPELLEEYALECAIPAIGTAEPQWETYERLEQSGAMMTFGVYAGALVGFAVVLGSVPPHYGVKVATVESLFVSKAHRHTGAGSKLMAHIERHAAGVGCKAILYSAPVGGQLESLLGRRYARTNTVFCKALA